MKPAAWLKNRWNARTRGAVLLWILLVFAVESALFYLKTKEKEKSDIRFDSRISAQIDSLKKIARQNTFKIYPFNPNYLTDYKAYMLGLDTAARNKIKAWRASGNFFESKEQFRRISGIPDSLYRILEPFIKIPSYKKHYRRPNYYSPKKPKRNIAKKDINTATAPDLQAVYGIGKVLSERIIRYRKKLGGFTIREQLKDIYALSPEAYENLWELFEIGHPFPVSTKIPLNRADMTELIKNPYIDEDLAEKIYEYRTLHGDFKNFEELKKIPGFPVDKFKRIVLYLTLK